MKQKVLQAVPKVLFEFKSGNRDATLRLYLMQGRKEGKSKAHLHRTSSSCIVWALGKQNELENRKRGVFINLFLVKPGS